VSWVRANALATTVALVAAVALVAPTVVVAASAAGAAAAVPTPAPRAGTSAAPASGVVRVNGVLRVDGAVPVDGVGTGGTNRLVGAPLSYESQTACNAPPPSGLLLVQPRLAELPVGASADFVVSGLVPSLAVGEAVTFQILCGPDAPGMARAYVAKHPLSSSPEVPAAYLAFGNHGGAGTDVVVITTTAPGGEHLRDVVQLSWVPPVNCGEPAPELGYVLAFECDVKSAAKKLAPLVATVKDMASCTIGVAGFFVPVAKLARLFKDADLAATAGELATKAAVDNSVAKLIFDLDQLSKASAVSMSQVYGDLRDAKNAAEFLRDMAALLESIPSGDVATIATDVASLAGLGGCITLYDDVVGAPAHWYSVSLDKLCSSAQVTNQSVNGCPYDGQTTIGGRSFSYEAFVDNNDDSVAPGYWDLVDVPASTCRSVTVSFGIPDASGAPGDVAYLKIAQGGVASSASAAHGTTTTFHVPLDGRPWALWNSATSSADEVAIRLSATCSTSSGL